MILLILFGAPLTTHFPHTILCATHMSLLAIQPLVYVHGVDGARWWEAASLYLPFDDVFGATMGTLLGAWFGAVPIPLDWYVTVFLVFIRLKRYGTQVILLTFDWVGTVNGRSGRLP